MAGPILGLTTNYKFAKLNFDAVRWGSEHNKNFDLLDSLLTGIGLAATRGFWQNSTPYINGERVVDPDGAIYICKVTHTSPVAGTFADDRTANPARWEVTNSLPMYRGTWATATVYSVNDVVNVAQTWKVCVQTHTSDGAGNSFASARWVTIIDITSAYNDVEADRVASAASASAAATGASTATTQAGIATTQANTATTQAGIAVTQAGNAATSATNALASQGVATTQAGLATTAANSAAASFDSFDDRYLGTRATNPTLDNDGNALLVGALYWNTTTNDMRVWSGSTWSVFAVSQAFADGRYSRITTSPAIAGSNGTTLPSTENGRFHQMNLGAGVQTASLPITSGLMDGFSVIVRVTGAPTSYQAAFINGNGKNIRYRGSSTATFHLIGQDEVFRFTWLSQLDFWLAECLVQPAVRAVVGTATANINGYNTTSTAWASIFNLFNVYSLGSYFQITSASFQVAATGVYRISGNISFYANGGGNASGLGHISSGYGGTVSPPYGYAWDSYILNEDSGALHINWTEELVAGDARAPWYLASTSALWTYLSANGASISLVSR